MIKTTTWSPDTCDCTLVYSWDTESPEDKRVHTPVSGVTCSLHTFYKNSVQEHHSAILAENQGKNKAYDQACIAVPRLVPDDFSYSFDSQRNLEINIKSLSGAELIKMKAVDALKNISVTSASILKDNG